MQPSSDTFAAPAPMYGGVGRWTSYCPDSSLIREQAAAADVGGTTALLGPRFPGPQRRRAWSFGDGELGCRGPTDTSFEALGCVCTSILRPTSRSTLRTILR